MHQVNTSGGAAQNHDRRISLDVDRLAPSWALCTPTIIGQSGLLSVFQIVMEDHSDVRPRARPKAANGQLELVAYPDAELGPIMAPLTDLIVCASRRPC